MAVANTYLSPRQHQVITLYSRGHKRAEIANLLQRSPKTIDNHVGRSIATLGARNIHHAIAIVAVSNALDDRS